MLVWKILVVEDQVAVATDIKSELNDMGFNNVVVHYNCESAIKEIKAGSRVPDLAILDINLGKGKKTGIEMAEFLNGKKIIPIIYLTGEPTDENFQNALLTYPAHFLEKPFKAKKLKRSIDLATSAWQSSAQRKPVEFLFVKKRVDAFEKKAKKIFIKEILWVKAADSYIDLNMVSEIHKGVENTLSDFNDAIRYPNLLQIHRSYIVNCDKIENIDLNYKFVVIGGKKIPISDSFRAETKKRIPLI